MKASRFLRNFDMFSTVEIPLHDWYVTVTMVAGNIAYTHTEAATLLSIWLRLMPGGVTCYTRC